MITTAAFILKATVNGKAYIFEYDANETNDTWDALEKFWHEDYPDKFPLHDGNPFPIDVYAMDIDGSILSSPSLFMFNSAMFHAFFDHGHTASGPYTLYEFCNDIKRKEN